MAGHVPFSPTYGKTTTLTTSTTNAHGALQSGQRQLRVYNEGTTTAFIKVGEGTTLTATTDDFPVGAGESRIISIGSNVNRVASILASGSGKVYFTPGTGA